MALAVSVAALGKDSPGGLDLNPQLAVVPTLREWHGSDGFFRFRDGAQIVLDAADAGALNPTAEAFQEDLASLTGRRLEIAQGQYPAPGDVFLTLHADDDVIGTEGYVLEIGVGVVVRAHSPAGVFYGTRSLLQMLVAGGSSLLLRGWARDYPQYSERGLMLDVSSRFVPISTLKRYIRHLAWYKFNDLQLELNDNGGFRLDGPAFPGLAARDGSYSETEFRDLQAYALVRGITITPEIDSPGHAAALTRYRPDLANPQHANLLNLASPDTYSFMASLWGALLPWFTGPRVAIGADEFDPEDGDGYRAYVNFLDTLLRRHGKSVLMWGSLSREPGRTPVRTDITLEQWDTAWSDPMAGDELGFPIINASSEFLYIVTPKSPWYADHIDARNLYEGWQPSIFTRGDASMNMPRGDPRLLGAMFDFWGDAASRDAFDRVNAAMPVVAEKLWNDASETMTYLAFAAAAERVRFSAGTD
jgi:Glycosyl hydrolase family 20, catalytic domain/Glycosyl hydrolase family 20, domain 2